MRIVREPRYRCEVCNATFPDMRSALDHEGRCREESFVRDGLLGEWVAYGDRILGIACMTRTQDSKVGVLDPAKESVAWYIPSALTIIDDTVGREHVLGVVRKNMDDSIARGKGAHL